MAKRKQGEVDTGANGAVGMVAEVEGDGAIMTRVRELGLDLVAVEGEVGLGDRQERVMRLPRLVEEWVRQHLDRRAERAGGLSQRNVLEVLASTTMRKRVKEEGGEWVSQKAAHVGWAWVAEREKLRAEAGEEAEGVERLMQGRGVVMPGWREAAMSMSGYGEGERLTVVEVREVRLVEMVYRALAYQVGGVSQDGAMWVEAYHQIGAWNSVKQTPEFRGGGGREMFWRCMAMLMLEGRVEGCPGRGPREGDWWVVAKSMFGRRGLEVGGEGLGGREGGEGVLGMGSWSAVGEESGGPEGVHLSGGGYQKVRVVSSDGGVGGESGDGSDEGYFSGAVGGSEEECGGGGGTWGGGGAGVPDGGAMLRDLLKDEQGQSREGVCIQGTRWGASGGGVWGGSGRRGQPGEEVSGLHQVGNEEEGVQGSLQGVESGESCGGSGGEAIHEGVAGEACEEGGTPVCLRALLHEAHTHMDQCDRVGAEGADRGWQVRQQVQPGESGGEGEVAAQVCFGGGIAEGERWGWQEGDEAGHTSPASPGDSGGSRVRDRDPAVVEDLMKWCPRGMFSESQARSLLEMVVYEDEVALLECSQVAGEQRAPKRRRRECFIIMEQGGADGVT